MDKKALAMVVGSGLAVVKQRSEEKYNYFNQLIKNNPNDCEFLWMLSNEIDEYLQETDA